MIGEEQPMQTSKGIRRSLLIVEDNELNREILCSILEDEYNLYTAENGKEGLEILAAHYSELSLVILDVYMPVCNGFEFLEQTRDDALLSSVPVIVATGSDNPEDEVKCLRLGASDFVTKPYNPDVVIGRARSIIKLKESVAALSVVEYDDLTGLYTMPAFYHHAHALLNGSSDVSCALCVLDIQNFKMINSVFGEKMGDEVLHYVGHCLKRYGKHSIMARQGDKFFILSAAENFPSGEESGRIIEKIQEEAPVQNLRLKIGFYPDIDVTQSASILCDRVVLAAASVKGDFSKTIGYYDDKIQKRLMEQQKMESYFEQAIAQKEFCVWYQPKVDPRRREIVAAEALVRWIKDDGKIVSPGAFIPLFEKDGLIIRLDEYMFRSVCHFQKERLAAGLRAVPVSINLSRNSIYRKDTAEKYKKIVEEEGIPIELVPIELTESAAIGGLEIEVLAQQLVSAGFSLHMDDFGVGYSSLSTLTILPFDVIKLDKSLIDQIGSDKGDILIRYMIRVVQDLGMHTVAEGVERQEQLDFLKKVGCDMIQGYYYSAPKPQDVFEKMLDGKDPRFVSHRKAIRGTFDVDPHPEMDLNNQSILMMERVAEGMEEGFFIYRADEEEMILYANKEILRIFGCEDQKEFDRLTGGTFKGMVSSEEYDDVEESIFRQINSGFGESDREAYHIVKRDGSIGHVKDRGYCAHTKAYGNIFYVFLTEDGGQEHA